MNAIEKSESKAIKDLASLDPQLVALAQTQLTAISLLRQGKVSVIMPDPDNDETWLWTAND
jgi:hypothetical protein